MPKKINLQEILKKNQHIDPKKLAEAIKLTEQLRNLGVTRRGYRLDSPLTRRRVRTDMSDEYDPRTVRLYRPHGQA